MKKNNYKTIKIIILSLLLFSTFGCTKYVKGDDNKTVTYEETGQTLTSNILCKPVTDELYNIYKENEDKLSTSLDNLPECQNYKPSDTSYTNLWETIFVKPLAWLILKVGNFVKNYGVAVIILGIVIRIILIPSTVKTMAQSEKIKKAQPEINKIEKKYANKTDNESLMAKSQETMMVYQKYKINPASGCLVSFIQLPILLAFYEAIQRVPAIFEGTLFNMNLGMTPSVGISKGNYIYIILVILIILTTYFSFRISMQSSMTDEAKQQMKFTMIFMIIMIGIMGLTLPTALALYWIVNSLFAIIQNMITKKIIERK